MNNVANKIKKGRRLNPLSEARSLILFCGVTITLVVSTALFSPPQLLSFLNYRTYDLLLSANTPAVPSDIPILVGIDDRSLKTYGQWPWPRYRLAQLVNKLELAGVDAVALDILMPEADRTSPEVIRHERARDLGESKQSFALLAEGQKSNDQLLAKALAKMATSLSYKFTFSDKKTSGTPASLSSLSNIVIQQVNGGGQPWSSPDSILLSLLSFREAASASGFTNVHADQDGVLRRVPLLMKYRGDYYPSLALATLRLAKNQLGLHLKREKYESVLQWGGNSIPLDEQGRLLLNYYDRKEPFAYYSASDLLGDKLPEGSLSGKVAFVGAWASGLGDQHATPLNKSTPGLEIHAVIASNLLSGAFLQQPAWARGAELFFVLAIGLLSTLLIARFGFLTNLVLFVVGAVFPLGGALIILNTTGVYIPPVATLLVLLINCSLLGIVRYGIETHKVHTRTRDLVAAQDSTILGMVSLSSARDKETGEHILRTQLYVKTLAQQLKVMESYQNELEDEDIELLFMSAPLHDIGKVGIPDHILHSSPLPSGRLHNSPARARKPAALTHFC